MTSFHPSLSKQKESDKKYPFLTFSSEHKQAEMPTIKKTKTKKLSYFLPPNALNNKKIPLKNTSLYLSI